jgi:hypothetical protein
MVKGGNTIDSTASTTHIVYKRELLGLGRTIPCMTNTSRKAKVTQPNLAVALMLMWTCWGVHVVNFWVTVGHVGRALAWHSTKAGTHSSCLYWPAHTTNQCGYLQKIFRYSCIIELSSNSTWLFGQELVVLQTTPSKLGKFSVHAQRESGGLNEHSISVYWGSNSFWYAKRCSIYLALNEPK